MEMVDRDRGIGSATTSMPSRNAWVRPPSQARTAL
jgi:hypothetical protein